MCGVGLEHGFRASVPGGFTCQMPIRVSQKSLGFRVGREKVKPMHSIQDRRSLEKNGGRIDTSPKRPGVSLGLRSRRKQRDGPEMQ